MSTYLLLKYLHILSMVVLFGTGLGTAWYKWMADRTGNVSHIAIMNKQVVLADWLFTTPAIIFQPISGIWLALVLNLPLLTPWIVWSLILYVLAGVCWLPVVWLQMRMRDLAIQADREGAALPAQYWRYARIWFWLGVPAFAAMLLVVFLMVFKTAAGV
uniref:DUF2269 domain-containing protein n=1 Tax=uncultured Thiotrichaceae bacterium TaxID=298394 RepID=A0A6S6TGJ9_9GAMM|nr:MAG: Unknown protein [uncultured Thiotrichaceae bacterium]